jgi:cyanophycinase
MTGSGEGVTMLALVGGGEFTERCEIEVELLKATGGGPVAVISAASAYEHPERRVARARARFAALGVEVIDVPVRGRQEANDPELAALVSGYRFVYLTDGSPLHLRGVLKNTPLLEALVSVSRDGVLVASGAAASCLGDPMLDPRGGAFTLGLGVLAPLAVLPSHETWSPERSRRTRDLLPDHVAVLSLDSATGVVRSEGRWTAFGPGNVSVHVAGASVGLDSLP